MEPELAALPLAVPDEARVVGVDEDLLELPHATAVKATAAVSTANRILTKVRRRVIRQDRRNRVTGLSPSFCKSDPAGYPTRLEHGNSIGILKQVAPGSRSNQV